MVGEIYKIYKERVDRIAALLARPMTYAEKVLYAHTKESAEQSRGESYVDFWPDRVAMQDATAQMAMLQFANSGKKESVVPASIHCDHLIEASRGANEDLKKAMEINGEVYDFLYSSAQKYGIGFWKAGAGIIHQVVLENYAFPGGMMVGTDSHTPNAGGLGMVAIGVGGADAVDVMTGTGWELKMPRLIGVKLSGKLSGWASPKDVILHLAGILTVKGGTNSIIEYFGEGCETISATGKATICNMGAEVGATCSIFGYDSSIREYLVATSREDIATLADGFKEYLTADSEVVASPESYYDRVIEIDLSAIEPYMNGPFTPDLAYPISKFKAAIEENDYPRNMEVGLVGSCTNSSYEDMARAASVAEQAIKAGLEVKSELIINPGSEQVYQTAKRDGIISTLEAIGAVIMTNACGPCIGQWKREGAEKGERNSIITSFNRNFAKRNDGNPNTFAFVASPEMVVVSTISGDLGFNPLTDTLTSKSGEEVLLGEPSGDKLPKMGYVTSGDGYCPPAEDGTALEVAINPDSERLERLEPFPANRVEEYQDMPLLLKAKGKCTTDHISMAGKWLRFRGHLGNISSNMLMGAISSFNDKSDEVVNTLTGGYDRVSEVARAYKKEGIFSVVVAEDNYGEGSSREHAAMEPRYLNVKAIIAKSFARIHETNLKKQGMLAATFANGEDYDKIAEGDRLSIVGLESFSPEGKLSLKVEHKAGGSSDIELCHTYNAQQIKWFFAGSALNYTKLEDNE